MDYSDVSQTQGRRRPTECVIRYVQTIHGGRTASRCSNRKQSTSQSDAGLRRLSGSWLSARYPPYVTAQAWAVTEAATGKFLWGSLACESREIASLTKVMTCYVALKLMHSDTDHLHKSALLPVSKFASTLIGTSAHLREGDELYLWDALFAMMLPSGNDAALAIAQFFGRYLKEKRPQKEYENIGNSACFVREMNKTAQEIGLINTIFANPHGLPDNRNRSCAKDINFLAFHAMQIPEFAQIVSTKRYSCFISQKSTLFPYRHVEWTNTNRLLDSGWSGVKTGVTVPAGPCLCAVTTQQPALIVTVLSCRSMEKRWGEVSSLGKWAYLKLTR